MHNGQQDPASPVRNKVKKVKIGYSFARMRHFRRSCIEETRAAALARALQRGGDVANTGRSSAAFAPHAALVLRIAVSWVPFPRLALRASPGMTRGEARVASLAGMTRPVRETCPNHSDRGPVKGKHDAVPKDKLLTSVARHLAKAEATARQSVLEAVNRLLRAPNAESVKAFAEEISAARLNAGARRSVIGAVMNALSRSRSGMPAQDTDEA